MKDIKTQIAELDQEISRVKMVANANGYHTGTAQNIIISRYRTELKGLRRRMGEDVAEDNITHYDNTKTLTKEVQMPSSDFSYNANNFSLVAFPYDAIIEIANVANKLGVLVHISGIPFGDYNQSSRTVKGKREED